MRWVWFLFVAGSLLLSSGRAQGQSSGASSNASAAAKDLTPEQIIAQMVEKETEFYAAWMQYTYVQKASIRLLSVDGAPSKEAMTLVFEVVFNDDGTREVRPLRRSGQLRSVLFTREDQEIIESLNPFALTAKELPLYDLKYAGKERVDELDCHVFSVKPKRIKKGRMYFEGRIWVDDLDLQIVRTVGKAVPQDRDNQYPEFETIRQVIDGKYWFPVWTHADSRLRFPDKTVRIEETITYENYQRFGSKATIRFSTPEDANPEP